MKIISLASGSKGNAYFVVAGGDCLLIDCGICCREIEQRAAAAGVDLARIVGIVFTHNHSDHMNGLAVFHRHYPEIPLFANLGTARAIAGDIGIAEDDFFEFENGQSFSVGGFEVKAFPTPHDAADSCGYLISADGETYFHGTDIGTPLDSIGECLRMADVATLESNYDPMLLKTSGRPPMLIERISGPRGHLSNDQAAELLRKYASPRLKRLSLAHLSQDCNTPGFAIRAIREALSDSGCDNIILKVFSQNETIVV